MRGRQRGVASERPRGPGRPGLRRFRERRPLSPRLGLHPQQAAKRRRRRPRAKAGKTRRIGMLGTEKLRVFESRAEHSREVTKTTKGAKASAASLAAAASLRAEARAPTPGIVPAKGFEFYLLAITCVRRRSSSPHPAGRNHRSGGGTQILAMCHVMLARTKEDKANNEEG